MNVVELENEDVNKEKGALHFASRVACLYMGYMDFKYCGKDLACERLY
jgi:hypothetical protein